MGSKPQSSSPIGFGEVFERLRLGDEAAAALIVRRFADRLIGLARAHLYVRLQSKLDPEDVVQSVFRSFFRRHGEGQFELDSWDGLWGLLVVMTLRKCGNQVTFFRADRRDLRRELPLRDGDSREQIMALAREPNPAEAAALSDLLGELNNRLRECDREVLALHLHGYSANEIAERIGRAVRTVWRSLKRIRDCLEQLHRDDPEQFWRVDRN